MSLVDKMFEKQPDKHPVFTAIGVLEDPGDIVKFHKDYRAYMIEEGYDAKTADSNIGYILGYYSEGTRKLWYSLLEVNHPIFGEDFGR